MSDISIQALLRGDPEIVAGLLAAAEQGNVDAQYRIGLIYAEGRGVAQDEVKSFYWLSRAVRQGDADAQTLLQVVAAAMTQEQHRQAMELADSQYDAYDSANPAVRRRSRAGRARKQNRRGRGRGGL
jgi:TPR repeat protein